MGFIIAKDGRIAAVYLFFYKLPVRWGRFLRFISLNQVAQTCKLGSLAARITARRHAKKTL
jgi:hypothetical protein